MKSDELPRIDRRTLVSGLALLPAAGSLLSTPVRAQNAPSAPLASWTDGPAKQAIINFVRATTDRSSPKFVAAEDHLPTLDRHPDAAVSSLIPALSCRSCRPHPPFAELVRLSKTSIADEFHEERRRHVLG